MRALVTQNREKVEVLKVFFASVLISKTGLKESQMWTAGKVRISEHAPLMEDQVSECLANCTYLGPVGMYTQVVRELAPVTARSLLVTFS